MHTLTVTRLIPAPIDAVFDAFVDHEALAEVPGVRSCTLARQGDTERNGLGAVRLVDCGPIKFREEITGFDRPHRMEYRIREAKPAAEHEFGQVDFAQTPAGTMVTWTTRFAVRVPVVGSTVGSVVGGLVDPAFGIGFGVAFRLVLHNVQRRALASVKVGR